MKLNRLEKSYAWLLLLIFGFIVLQAPISVGFGTLFPAESLVIKSWAELLMLLATAIGVIILSRRRLWRWFWHTPLIILSVIYVALHVALLLVHWQDKLAASSGLAIDLRYVLYFVSVLVLMKVAPMYRSLMLKVGVIGAGVVTGFGTLQLFLPANILSHIGYNTHTIEPYLTVDKNHAYIRINSTLRGPNPVGAYAVIVLAAIMGFWLKRRAQLTGIRAKLLVGILTTCSLVILWISYSRSALVALLIALVAIGLTTYGTKLSRRVWLGIGIGIVVLAVIFALGARSSFVSNVFLHDNPAGGSSTKSDQGHLSSLHTGLKDLVHLPLGGGIGSTGSASLYTKSPLVIENQFLFIAHESGWLGLGLFLAVLLLLFKGLWRRRRDWLALSVIGSGLGLIFIGLLLPVWVDDTISIVWWGLAALALGGDYERPTTK